MGYQLEHKERVANGVRRIMRETLAGAIMQLNRPSGELTEAVHECRKALKKARSLARMTALVDNDAKSLRAAARLLAPLREEAAHVECLERLASAQDANACRDILEQLKAHFTSQYDVSRENAAATAAILLEAQQIIANASVCLDAALDGGCTTTDLLAGLTQSYARGRRALRRAAKATTPDMIHALRKRAKDLRYQTCILMNAWPAGLGMFESELHRFTDYLGAAHDLALLQTTVSEATALPINPRQRAAAIGLMERQYAVACQQAQHLGECLFAEKPAAFTRRMRAYCRAWRSALPVPPTP